MGRDDEPGKGRQDRQLNGDSTLLEGWMEPERTREPLSPAFWAAKLRWDGDYSEEGLRILRMLCL